MRGPTPTMVLVIAAAALSSPACDDTATSVSLTITVGGTGTGVVTSEPPGIACPPTCTTQLAPGTPLVLTATPGSAATFGAWSGACASAGAAPTCTVDPVAGPPLAAGASFVLGAPLEVTIDGTGTVLSDPAGIDCPGRCVHAFQPGTEVVLRTQLRLGVSITGWSDDCAGAGWSCTLLMDRGRRATLHLDGTGALKRFTRAFRGSADQGLARVVATGDGGFVVAGSHALETELGDTTIATPGVWLARYDATGARQWLTPLVIEGGGGVGALRVLTGGDLAVAGTFAGTIDLGDGPVSAQDSAAFMVVLDGASGQPRWNLVVDGPQADRAAAVVEHAGALVLAGAFTTVTDFGGGLVFTSEANPSGFLASYALADGAFVQVDIPPGEAGVFALERLGGDLLVGAAAGTTTQWGDTTLPAGLVLVRRDGPAGAVRWARSLGNNANLFDSAHFVDAGDTWFLATHHQNEWTVDGMTLIPDGFHDGVVFAFASSDGTTEWLRRLVGPGYALPRGLTVRGERVLAAGWFTGSLGVADAGLEAGSLDGAGFLVELGVADGAPLAATTATASVGLQLDGLTRLSDGALVLIGSFIGSAGLDVGPLPFASDRDAFLAVFEP